MPVLDQAPGPVGWPFFGVLGPFRRNPAEYLLRLSREYGDIVRFRVGDQQLWLLNRPELIEEVLVSNQSNFTKSRLMQRAKKLLGQGLLTSEGQKHLHQRRLVQPAFHRERLASYAETMVRLAERSQSSWQSGQVVDVAAEMMRLTLAIVSATLFSREVGSEASEIGRALTDVLESFDTLLMPYAPLMERLPFGSIARARRAQKKLDLTIHGIIQERRAEAVDRGDLLSALLAADDGNDRMSDSQVRDETMTLMLAGHETTANALTWTWYLISQHPDIEECLRDEWDEVLGGRQPEFSDFPKLAYTECVFAEALRLYPPAWAISRLVRNEFRLFNHLVPAGAVCVMSPWVMHRNPRFWPEPESFRPGRFTPEAKAMRPKFSYFPFGGGARMCVGERFAWLEGVLLLAAIGQRWKLRLAPGHQVKIRPQITLRPRYGMKMIAERVVA